MDSTLFEFDDVVLERDGRRVLAGVTGSIPDHGMTVIAGPSGSGKSSLLRLCNRLEAATSGSVRYGGRPIGDCDPLALRRNVGMIFQRPTALPGTVADNLRAGTPGATGDEVDGALDRVGLAGLGDRTASSLSGGEAQRMCLARTLLTGPRFVLFDEPTSSLDRAAALAIEDLATGLADEGVSSAWVTHDMAQLRRLAHHVLVIAEGVIVQQGHVDDVLADPRPAVATLLAGGGDR